MKKINIILFFYYVFAKHLPSASFFINGVKLRRWLCREIFLHCGDNVNIAKNVHFGRGLGLSIGSNSGIGEGAYITTLAEIVIGSDVMIGPQVMMLTGGHSFNNPREILASQPPIKKPINIGNDVWIGARVIILPGAVIENRVIVAAGAVVSGRLRSKGVYGGIPARKISDIP